MLPRDDLHQSGVNRRRNRLNQHFALSGCLNSYGSRRRCLRQKMERSASRRSHIISLNSHGRFSRQIVADRVYVMVVVGRRGRGRDQVRVMTVFVVVVLVVD